MEQNKEATMDDKPTKLEQKAAMANVQNLKWYAFQLESIYKSYESNHGKDDYISKCMVRGCGRELSALAKCLKNMSKMLKEEAAN